MSILKSKIKLVIYTSLFGNKEKLGNPLIGLEDSYTDLDISFVCFTDSSIHKSNSWQVRIIEDHFLPSDKFSRRVKTMPHIYFPDIKYSLFVDNTVTFKRLPNSNDLFTNIDYLFKLFQHSGRINLFEELLAVNGLGYDLSDNLLTMKEFYTKYVNLSDVSPLSTNTIILREHNNPVISNFGEIWWEHILNFSKRDQLSFDFIRMMTSTKIEYFSGTKMDNDLVYPQQNFSSSRILANFDEKKYSFINKIPQSQFNTAKGNYYDSNPNFNSSNLYARRNSNFSMIANLCFSGMTHRFAPRRKLECFLESKLKQFLNKNTNLLFIYNDTDGSSTNFTEEEFTNFTKTISIYLNDSHIDNHTIASIDDFSNILNESDLSYDGIFLFNCNEFFKTNANFNRFFSFEFNINTNIFLFSELSITPEMLEYFYKSFIEKKLFKNICSTGYFHDLVNDYIGNSVIHIS